MTSELATIDAGVDWSSIPRVPGTSLYGRAEFGQLSKTAAIGDLHLDVTVHPTGAAIPDHVHRSPLLVLVLEGEIEERREGRVAVGRPGSLMVRPEGVVHAVRALRRTRLFTIEPGPAWLEQVGARAIGRQLRSGEWNDRLASLALDVYAAFTSIDHGPAGPLALQGYLQALLAELVRPDEGGSEPLWLRDARRYLDSHLSDRFDLEALARRVGVHPVHLSRSFRKFYGLTITEHLRRSRLSSAMARLSTSDDPISAVATGVGFADQSHLTRAFRRVLGGTPGGFRAAMRERPHSEQ